ncbi:type II toxin-antitoxin system HipA family toxin, partial [Mesorhizobium japonicum]|uniref:type II toxin-antitoxin system HipA family toxin n=1 Tax=Mesorhizobium japonicum TaxID=2066070 RepID=UPI003B5AB7B5
YEPDLPLRPGTRRPDPDWEAHGCILDAGPDYWGRRVILAKHFGHLDEESDTDQLDLLTYLLESGSDRIGALDFQESAREYVPRERDHGASLEQLMAAADDIQAGRPVPPALESIFFHGTSIGGARPKALLDHGDRRLIAKFSRANDDYPMVKGEAIAMHLAAAAGLNVARTEFRSVAGRDTLLVERFDRGPGGIRRAMVSALTMMHRRPFGDRRPTYPEFADLIRRRFTDPDATLRELFGRIVFSVIVGNTDDHGRNHAAFWDGTSLTLTPGYDIGPQPRNTGEADQGMAIDRNGDRRSRLEVCVRAAPIYHLSEEDALEIVDHQLEVVRSGFEAAADLAEATEVERNQLWSGSFLNPSIFYSA